MAGQLQALALVWALFFEAEFPLLDRGPWGLAWLRALVLAVLRAAGLAVVAVAVFSIWPLFVLSLPYSVYHLASDLSLALIAPFPSPRWVVRREDRA